MRQLFYFFCAITLASFFFACGSRNNQKTDQKIEENTPSAFQQNEVITVSDNDTVNIPIKDGYGKVTLSKRERQTAYISFDAEDYKQLYGKITSKDSMANVRFTQIFIPDGSADGPFWNEIKYNLSQKGRYKISIGENMMAGDPWGGIFTVEIRLSR